MDPPPPSSNNKGISSEVNRDNNNRQPPQANAWEDSLDSVLQLPHAIVGKPSQHALNKLERTSSSNDHSNNKPPIANVNNESLMQSFLALLDDASSADVEQMRAIFAKSKSGGGINNTSKNCAIGTTAGYSADTNAVNISNIVTKTNSNISNDHQARKKILADAERAPQTVPSSTTFDERLRQKLSSNQSERAHAQSTTTFDERLRQKLSANQAERAHAPTSGTTFDERLRGKLSANQTERAHAPTSGTTFDERLGGKLSANQTERAHAPTSGTTFDERLKGKLSANQTERAHAPTSGTTFDERLRGKLSANQTERAHAPSGTTFDERLGGKLSANQTERAHAPTSGTTFDERLGGKLSANQTERAHAPTSGTTFDERLRGKLSANQTERAHAPTSGTTFDERLRGKLSANQAGQGDGTLDSKNGSNKPDIENGGQSGSTFDDRLREKLNSARNNGKVASNPDTNIPSASEEEETTLAKQHTQEASASRHNGPSKRKVVSFGVDTPIEPAAPPPFTIANLGNDDDVLGERKAIDIVPDSGLTPPITLKISEYGDDNIRQKVAFTLGLIEAPDVDQIVPEGTAIGNQLLTLDEERPSFDAGQWRCPPDGADPSGASMINASVRLSTDVSSSRNNQEGEGVQHSSVRAPRQRLTFVQRIRNRTTIRQHLSSRMDRYLANMSSANFIQAIMVEEEPEMEVVEAKQIGYLESKSKMVFYASLICLVSVLLAVILPITLNKKPNVQSSNASNAGVEPWCSPCIDRGKYKIKVVSGLNPSLGNIEANHAAYDRAASDMGVELDLEPFQKGKDVVDSAAGVDALVMGITSEDVAYAVRHAADKGVPVFGIGHIGTGGDFVTSPEGLIDDGSLLLFIGMDDYLAGEMAASYFLQRFSNDNSLVSGEYTQALFITQLDEGRNTTYHRQFTGYHDRLTIASNNTINITWIEVREPYIDSLKETLSECKYQSVLVGMPSPNLLREVTENIKTYGCQDTKIGTIGTSSETEHQIMETNTLDFALAQNVEGHSRLAIQLAALYVTTKNAPLSPSSGDGYFLAPVLYTKDNYTRDGLLMDDIDRKEITIGGVVHGTTEIQFWNPVFSAAKQAANDMGVNLKFDRIEPQGSANELHSIMAKKIRSLCREGVDGLFVTLPADVVVDAVRECKEMYPNITILSINVGYEKSKKLRLLHHIGMIEKDAGYQAGKKMATIANVTKALCVNHEPWLADLVERCVGFGEAVKNANIEYLGQVNATSEAVNAFAVESKFGGGDWDGYGMMLVTTPQLPAALELKKEHTKLALGTFDTSQVLYESLESEDVLFGIEQQPYLQGYMPISILTHAITSGKSISNHLIKSGPSFVTTIPADEEMVCREKDFPVCSNDVDQSRPSQAPTATTEPTSSLQPSPSPTEKPSSSLQPSSSPTFDPRPTLDIVRERGHVLCGMLADTIDSRGYQIDLCRALASVLIGNSESYRNVSITGVDRFHKLNGRSIDVLLGGDTHTIEREVMENSTGVGFTFSTPYYYDGMAYYGEDKFVECAENKKRYEDCSKLSICTITGSSHHDYLARNFPPEFYSDYATLSFEDQNTLMPNGTCNVITHDRTFLLNFASANNANKTLIVGEKLMTKEPLAIVSRKGDPEFSDVINWIVQALYFGEEQGLKKDDSLCQQYTSLALNAPELNYLNSVYCVGNYGEIVFGGDTQVNHGMNQINNGESGMLYATPFGDLNGDDEGGSLLSIVDTSLEIIKQAGSLNCGVVSPADTGITSDKIGDMSADYCHAIAAALFHGNYVAVNITYFSDTDGSSFAALNNGTIDVLAGVRIEQKYDFAGLQFSTPYYYGNESASADGHDVSFYSLATREDGTFLSSFINMVVLATIHAHETGLDKSKSEEMPLVSVLGNELAWALRDAISYSGNCDELYRKHFGDVASENRGRNALNDGGGPQLHSLPGIIHKKSKPFER